MKSKAITSTLVAICSTAALQAQSTTTQESDIDALFVKTGTQLKANSISERFTFGSYGELHGRIGDGDDNLDLHRIVLLGNIKITEKLRFITEVEFEHSLFHSESGAGKELEKEFEQGYFEYSFNKSTTFNAGVQIIPVGIVNTYHEPTVFNGVERPNVERNIIPSTWREASVGMVKQFDNGFALNAVVHAGLDTSRGSEGNIRGGRPGNRDYLHAPESLAVTLAGRYSAIPGIELGGAIQYQNDISSSVAGSQSAFLFESHGVYTKGNFELRALGAYWKADDYNGLDVDGQWGYYIEPAYKIDTPIGKAAVFTRFSRYNYLKGTAKTDRTEYTIGMNFWPTDETVLKVDYTNSTDGKVNDETVNFGIGYYF